MALDPSIILSLTKGKTYRIGSAGDITFPAGSVVLGYGLINIAAAASFVFGADSRVCNIAFQTNQDRPIISLVLEGPRVPLGREIHWRREGRVGGAGKVSQDAVYIETAEGCALYGCYAYNLGGSLMRCKTTNGGRGGNAAIGCVARECNNAFFADYAGEYMSVTGCPDGCNTGARVSGGNFVWTGGQLSGAETARASRTVATTVIARSTESRSITPGEGRLGRRHRARRHHYQQWYLVPRLHLLRRCHVFCRRLHRLPIRGVRCPPSSGT